MMRHGSAIAGNNAWGKHGTLGKFPVRLARELLRHDKCCGGTHTTAKWELRSPVRHTMKIASTPANSKPPISGWMLAGRGCVAVAVTDTVVAPTLLYLSSQGRAAQAVCNSSLPTAIDTSHTAQPRATGLATVALTVCCKEGPRNLTKVVVWCRPAHASRPAWSSVGRVCRSAAAPPATHRQCLPRARSLRRAPESSGELGNISTGVFNSLASRPREPRAARAWSL